MIPPRWSGKPRKVLLYLVLVVKAYEVPRWGGRVYASPVMERLLESGGVRSPSVVAVDRTLFSPGFSGCLDSHGNNKVAHEQVLE